MKFGVWYDFRSGSAPAGPHYRECLSEIVAAEELGYASAWLSEHHFVEDGYLPAQLQAAGVIAGRTSKLRIGTNVLLLPLYHPLRVAEDAAVLDLLSDRRLTLGVGGGYVDFEFETFGVERRFRPSLMEEGVAVMRQAWRTGRIGFQGKRWQFPDRPFTPQPERDIPLYFGANSEPAIKRAAQLADGFLIAAGGDPRVGVQQWQTLQAELRALGREREPFPIVYSAWVWVDEDPERAWQTAAPAIAYQMGRYADWGTDRDKPRPAPLDPSQLDREKFCFIGHPDQVAERLLTLQKQIPFEELCFWGRLPGLTHAQARAHLELFQNKVVPQIQAELTALS